MGPDHPAPRPAQDGTPRDGTLRDGALFVTSDPLNPDDVVSSTAFYVGDVANRVTRLGQPVCTFKETTLH